MRKLFKQLNYPRYLTQTKNDQILFLLIISDLIFISIHCLIKLGILNHLTTASKIHYYKILTITTDQSIPETFQYIKELWVLILLGALFCARKELIHLIWAFLFAFFLLDDFLGIHENIGGIISKYMGFLPDNFLRLQDWGELIITIAIGLFFSAFLAITFLKSGIEGKRISVILSILVLILAFFGVGLDMLHSVARSSRYLNEFIAILEDGGEMLVMTSIFWYLFNIDYFNEMVFSKNN